MTSRDDVGDELAQLRRENARLVEDNERLRVELAQQRKQNRVLNQDLEDAESAVRVYRRRVCVLVDRLDADSRG